MEVLDLGPELGGAQPAALISTQGQCGACSPPQAASPGVPPLTVVPLWGGGRR